MKHCLSVITLCSVVSLGFLGCTKEKPQDEPITAPKSLEPAFLWMSGGSFDAPESIYAASDGFLYVSNIGGGGDKKDGRGWIAKLNKDGSVVTSQFVGGLNAPKGMRDVNGRLWVSDIDEVVEIDLADAKIIRRVKVKGAKFLNDVAISGSKVFVSDTVGNSIYVIENGKAKVFVSGDFLGHPNGLLMHQGKLVVTSWGADMKPDWSSTILGHVYSLDLKTKKQTFISKSPLGNLDGLEFDGTDFIVSDWMSGKVYKVTSLGESTEVFSGKKGLADIGLIDGGKTLLVPSMLESKVFAKKL
jgi:sugar lactone lactonase YvrE